MKAKVLLWTDALCHLPSKPEVFSLEKINGTEERRPIDDDIWESSKTMIWYHLTESHIGNMSWVFNLNQQFHL